MAANQPDLSVTIGQLPPQPILSIRAAIRIADLGAAIDERVRALWRSLRTRGIVPAGPPFVRYHTFGEGETDFELGLPVGESVAGEGRIAAGRLLGGPAAATWHVGAHDTLGAAYARLNAWLAEHGHAPQGAPWEVYPWLDPGHYDGPASLPDPAGWRTQLVQPIRSTHPAKG